MRNAFVGIAVLFCASCATAGSDRFDGVWSHHQECGFWHSANLELHQDGDRITGSWDDGTRVWGEDGELAGRTDGEAAVVRFCVARAKNPEEACPNYGDRSARFERSGADLIWFRGEEPYITLHPVVPGSEVPPDNSDCSVGIDN